LNSQQLAVYVFLSASILGCTHPAQPARPAQPVISAEVRYDEANQTLVQRCLAKFNVNKSPEYNKKLTKECFELIKNEKPAE